MEFVQLYKYYHQKWQSGQRQASLKAALQYTVVMKRLDYLILTNLVNLHKIKARVRVMFRLRVKINFVVSHEGCTNRY